MPSRTWCLVEHGVKVTFVNTEYIHMQMKEAMSMEEDTWIKVHQVFVTVGFDSLEDRKDLSRKLTEEILRTLGWALEIAEKKAIKLAAYSPAAAALTVLGLSIPKLIDDGVIDDDGTPTKKQVIKLSPDMLAMNTKEFAWACLGSKAMQKNVFELMLRNNKSRTSAEWLLYHTHKRVMNALADEPNIRDGHIHLVSIPDGLEPWDDKNELGQLCEAIYRVMPGKLEELIEKVNEEEGTIKIKMSKPHIIAIPYPAQGHVIPLMELSQCLVNEGFKVTFVNTDFNHKRVMSSLADETHTRDDQIHMVSIPDGLEPWEDRNDLGKLCEAILRVMPGKLEELIEKIKEEEGEVSCIIADESNGWALEVAEKMKIKKAAFWPASAALLALGFCIPKLIHEGIIDDEGTALKSQMINLAQGMPTMKTEDLTWLRIGDTTTQKIIFQVMLRSNKTVKLADWVLCNSAFKLERGAFTLAPQILPIGPLLASNRLDDSAGNFWPPDSTCLEWLDQQSPSSVIYVAFGSFTIFDQIQFQELALALEQTNRPFLWVVRPDISEATPYPEGYKERVGSRGLMVGWAPQQKVLSHPSIACFLSHCGWNSTLEGLCNGVPFLCWPYFADQFLNESYICDFWQVGLKFTKNESGIIPKKEIKQKVERLLRDVYFKARALTLKEMVMSNVKEGGLSNKMFKNFIAYMKS
ncbi:hypothetical protein ACLB2K_067751 [Fragaria x ananassa]